ncbi:MAG: Lrp/AsnC ligand binding domain-containing protein [Thaumarchaeota archaeon]|nr:Lrp/AsnC ligand binding domain-containing protein [Candidatus Calditenuaceae archaeon]MDW8041669.1 Lrp/AsnC ligand binding domain-containing protein [Nitrososphaerota archaeon]
MGEGKELIAFVHLCVEPNHVSDIISNLCSCQRVTRVYGVTGEYDVIAIVKVRDLNELHRFLRSNVMNLRGIKGATTSIVLEERFAVGETVDLSHQNNRL